MVKLESCLLTSYIWMEKGVMWPPRFVEPILSQADGSDDPLEVSPYTRDMLYESTMTEGVDIDVTRKHSARDWFSRDELKPPAPSNLGKKISTMVKGDLHADVFREIEAGSYGADPTSLPTDLDLHLRR